MFVVAEPIERPPSSFIIEHNGIEYTIDIYKMCETSHLFHKFYMNRKDQNQVKFTFRDMHSSSAFSTFIKLCNYERCIVDYEDQIEVASLLDEWQCPVIQASFSKVFTNKPLYEGKSEPFKEIPFDQKIEQPSKITISSSKSEDFEKETTTDNHSSEKSVDNLTEETSKSTNETEKQKEEINQIKDQKIPIQTIKVHIKTKTGSLYSIQIINNQTIDSLQKMILIKTGIPLEQQVLIYNGKILSPENVISSYGIKNKSSIYLERRDPNEKDKEIIITLKHQTTSDVPYLISPSKKVSDLLIMIKNKEKYESDVNVIYNGQQLDKDKTFRDYGIVSNTDLLLLCST